ncbi:hypothetical protein JXX18_21425, partial [Ruthenibacterium lactatiformans]|nr:hypothetical protein [Ruthenibacterium lactatiformans]
SRILHTIGFLNLPSPIFEALFFSCTGDYGAVTLFRELLIEYKKQEKLIILTSHNKEDIESLCDHTYRIQSGQIIAE